MSQMTKLSSKGQVVIPQAFRNAHGWAPGLELMVVELDDGIFVRPKPAFSSTTLVEVAGLLRKKVTPKTDAQIQSALNKNLKKVWRGRR